MIPSIDDGRASCTWIFIDDGFQLVNQFQFWKTLLIQTERNDGIDYNDLVGRHFHGRDDKYN
jgi:hypothetical protein